MDQISFIPLTKLSDSDELVEIGLQGRPLIDLAPWHKPRHLHLIVKCLTHSEVVTEKTTRCK